jgi:hypothetical protein
VAPAARGSLGSEESGRHNVELMRHLRPSYGSTRRRSALLRGIFALNRRTLPPLANATRTLVRWLESLDKIEIGAVLWRRATSKARRASAPRWAAVAPRLIRCRSRSSCYIPTPTASP